MVAVADGRNLSVPEVRGLATGQPYTGRQARDLGLLDELGGLDEAIELAASVAGISAPEVEVYSPPTSFLEKLLGGFSSPWSLPFSKDELLFLKVLEGWQGMPRYQLLTVAIGE